MYAGSKRLRVKRQRGEEMLAKSMRYEEREASVSMSRPPSSQSLTRPHETADVRIN